MNSGFNTKFDAKDKVTMEFGIILSLMLIVSQQSGLKLDWTRLELIYSTLFAHNMQHQNIKKEDKHI